MRAGSESFILISCLLGLWTQVSDAIQCYQCEANPRDGRFCRTVAEARLVDCANDATFCSALVWMQDGQVNVHRGCEGRISSWGFGRTECDIMHGRDLMDTGVAFYQCRGDACNNIEPAEETSSKVVLITQSTGNSRMNQNSRHSNMNSQSMENSHEEESNSFASDSGRNAQVRGSVSAGSASSFPSNHGNSARNSNDMSRNQHHENKVVVEDDDDEGSSYGMKPKPRPPPPPPPPKPSYGEVREEEEETPTRPPPPPPPPKPRPTPPPYNDEEVLPEEVTERRKVVTPRPPPPPPPPKPSYGEVRDEEEEEIATRPPPPPPPPKPRPTPPPYNQEEVIPAEVTEERIVLTTPKRRVTTTTTEAPEEDIIEEQTEAPAYAPRTTTTTTKARPKYGEDIEIKDVTEPERVVTRPRRRGFTVFDRR